MTLSSQPLSPLDGRYLAQVRELGEHLSEAGLNRARVQVEVEWLIWLVEKDLLQVNKTLSEKEAAKLRELVSEFSDESVEKLGKIEATTRHDVKAVEYFVRDALTAMKREDLHELVHFACTSEDINNLSYAITVHDALERAWLPKAKDALKKITRMAGEMKNVPMLSRTHGQPATPTTMGKEFAVFAHRLHRQLHRI